MSLEKDNVSRLLAIMAQLRDPENGCPWDIKQNFASIVTHTIEEAYEVADAIASGDREEIKQECGDLLFQVVFYAQLGKEEGSFDFDQIAKAIADKLERRHPHVFAEQSSLSLDELNTQWETIKQQEKPSRAQSVFAGVPSGLPSLKLAYKLQKACAKVGFDWPDAAPVFDKVREEVDEIDEAMAAGSQSHIREEIGDALFALVNLARHHHIDADQALRDASHKFQQRFQHVESQLTADGRSLSDYSLEQMESAWNDAKRQSKNTKKTEP